MHGETKNNIIKGKGFEIAEYVCETNFIASNGSD